MAGKKVRRLSGWGIRDRPFSPKEFKTSWLKKNTSGMSYPDYLKNYAREFGRKRKR